MESNTFKSVTFGGFDKQDVIRYIENSAREHKDELTRLQNEIEALRQDNDALSAQNTELASKCEQLEARVKTLDTTNEEQQSAYAQLQQKTAAQAAELEALRTSAAELEALKAEAHAFRAEAESYRQFRNRIGDIECDARKRAAALEEETMASMLTMVSDFNTKYQELSRTFDTTSNYVSSELRKIDVILTQLPRALDQLGTELNTLENTLRTDKAE